MASALLLTIATLLFLSTTFFARNAQAIIARKILDRYPATEAELGELPWLALLEMPNGVYCSGTIVSPTSILSAALCLNGVKNLANGTVYAGNVQYKTPKDFDPPTQKRFVVEYHLYDEDKPLIYNLMLVKIDQKWTWSRTVQPISIVESESLPTYFTPLCNVSGLGYGSSTEEDSKVARSADMWMGTWKVCLQTRQEHRMCTLDQDVRAPCVGDLGGPVLCDTEPKDRLYGIISEGGHSGLEEYPDHCKIPARASGFQFVGFYAPWIKKTAGDLPSAEEVKAVREKHGHDFLPSRRLRRRMKRDDEVTEAPAPGGDAVETTTAGAEVHGLSLLALLSAGVLL